jgi:hypothetical protein
MARPVLALQYFATLPQNIDLFGLENTMQILLRSVHL